MSKKIMFKIIDIIAILILIYWLFIKSYNMVFEEHSFIELINNINLLPQVLLIFTLMIFVNMLELFFSFKGFVLLFYVGCRFISKRISTKNMQHENFNIEYFRDDLNKLSPSYVSYLLDFNINIENDIPAHILKLQLDGYIKEENEKLILTNKNQDQLNASDKLLLETIQNNFEIFDIIKYERLIKEELINQKYIKQKITKEKASKIIIATIIIYILSILGTTFVLPQLTSMEYVSSTVAILFFIMFIFNIIGPFIIGWLFFIIKSIEKGTRLKRTEKGNELLEKIYGLKNFLKEFTSIDDVRLEELKLREHYLIYAVTFDINNNVENEMLTKIKKHINKIN